MNYWSICLLLVSLFGTILRTGGVELSFELPDNAKQCFYEEIKQNTTAMLEFQVVTGGQYDVDVILEAPNTEIIYKQIKTQFDSHQFTASMSGAYKACFSNEFSTFSHKLVYMDFRMESSLEEVHKHLNSILDYQTHHRLREAQGRKRAEDLNNRVLLWSIMETLTILIISVGQVYVLRTFFTERKR
ncbi:transmembrane emp24 domain-containing protein 7 isoform X2 [Bombus terrestris]|uniref:Transmembrane emp24 domain-containing protein 7 isoform X2 n=1 Tax=Bombus terrestris TaxID=30195 RepID=A0A9C6SKK0_BOMTE|nr:transmembrane emp24 domain-containing protein 7 isoform X2 [Bombus terrestris]